MRCTCIRDYGATLSEDLTDSCQSLKIRDGFIVCRSRQINCTSDTDANVNAWHAGICCFLSFFFLLISSFDATQVCIARHGQVQPKRQWSWGQRGGGQWLRHGKGISCGQTAVGGGVFWPDTPRDAPSTPPRWAAAISPLSLQKLSCFLHTIVIQHMLIKPTKMMSLGSWNQVLKTWCETSTNWVPPIVRQFVPVRPKPIICCYTCLYNLSVHLVANTIAIVGKPFFHIALISTLVITLREVTVWLTVCVTRCAHYLPLS